MSSYVKEMGDGLVDTGGSSQHAGLRPQKGPGKSKGAAWAGVQWGLEVSFVGGEEDRGDGCTGSPRSRNHE